MYWSIDPERQTCKQKHLQILLPKLNLNLNLNEGMRTMGNCLSRGSAACTGLSALNNKDVKTKHLQKLLHK
jgi:hypothetical protein